MVERGFARTFQNFSTIFVIVAVVVFPLHLVYTFTFRDVIGTSDFHKAIEAMPDKQEVGDVSPPELDRARLVFWLLTAGELILLPFAARATRRAFEMDDLGEIPTATDAWAAAFRRAGPGHTWHGPLGPAAIGLATAIVCGLLIDAIGGGLTSFFGTEWRWAGEALTRGMTRAGALPFFLGPLAATRAKEEAPLAPKLY